MGHHWFRETILSEAQEAKEADEPEVRAKGEDFLGGNEVKGDSSAEVSAKAYEQTISDITARFGVYMTEGQTDRIHIEGKLYKPVVMTPEAYCERFPDSDPNVLGHYDSNGRVYMKDGPAETLTHVATHEAVHLTSFNERSDAGCGRHIYRSGIRETAYEDTGFYEDRNRGLNEGMTELFAIREMAERGDSPSIEAVSAYPEAQKAAFELTKIVGDEKISEAYFGGKTEQLKDEVIRLSYGDETAWDRFSQNIDIIEYGTDEEEIRAARRSLTIQNAIMLSYKEAEAWTGSESQLEKGGYMDAYQ